MRATVRGVGWRWEAEIPTRERCNSGWARRRKGDEGEAVKAVTKSKFEKPRKRRGRKKTQVRQG